MLQARAWAWAAAAAGDLPTARARLEEAADFGEEIGHLVGAATALHGLARLGRARQVAGRLADLAAQVDGELVVARAAYANAVAARDRQALHEVSEAFEGLGASSTRPRRASKPPPCRDAADGPGTRWPTSTGRRSF